MSTGIMHNLQGHYFFQSVNSPQHSRILNMLKFLQGKTGHSGETARWLLGSGRHYRKAPS